MEAVLPSVNKLIVEPGTASVLPYLPLSPGGPVSAPPPAAAPAAGAAQ